jgi:hypothetical protein
MSRLPMLLLMLALLGGAGKALAPPIESKPVTVNLSELPGLRHSWKRIEFEGPPTFDQNGKCLCVAAHIWATNADFTQELHYVILNAEGVVQTSSESTPDMNLLAKFPDLAVKLFHRSLISRDDSTNMFLDLGRWVVAPDLSWCARVRQLADMSDRVEKLALKPTVEKLWAWTCKGEYGPPSCQMSYVVLPSKGVIAISRSFMETVLLDEATGTNVDVIPYGPGRGIVSNLALAACIIPQKGWLVCDEQESKRIRVISLSPPHRILKEVGEKGINGLGVWSTPRLEPTADGQLLLKVSHWGSRLAGGRTEAEIYDTGTWKVLWRHVDRTGGEIALSPDGKRLALLKGQILEMRPFLSK